MAAATYADASPNGFHERARIMRLAVHCENIIVAILIIVEDWSGYSLSGASSVS
jgi:hypothetical protein